MTDDDIELIHSPLTQTHSADGHTLHIHIYRLAGSPWTLEIEDEIGTSSVWDESFDSDTAALEAAFLALESEGVHRFVTRAQQAAQEAEPERLRQLAQSEQPPPPDKPLDLLAPLTDEELDDLDGLLLELDAEEGMTLDMLDGFVHALVIGPETVPLNRWLPKVWGLEDDVILPPSDDMDQAAYLLGLILRHHNSIAWGFDQRPPVLAPMWVTRKHDTLGEFEDAEMWARGFNEGMKLSEAAWQPMFNHPQGQAWYRPIWLLGADDFSPDQDELIRMPAQRAALTAQIEASLLKMHAFWLPLREAADQSQQPQRVSNKVGRNEPCPCGSGKKYKKCCGAPSALH